MTAILLFCIYALFSSNSVFCRNSDIFILNGIFDFIEITHTKRSKDKLKALSYTKQLFLETYKANLGEKVVVGSSIV